MDYISYFAEHNTIPEENITEDNSDLLSNPLTVLTEIGHFLQSAYSKEQMLEMYVRGFRKALDTKEGKRMLAAIKYNSIKPYPEMKKMFIQEERYFPVSKWNAARSAASMLKSYYGTLYTVEKITNFGGKGSKIKVTRLK